MIVLYDLPSTRGSDIRNAAKFRKELKRAGYVQVQLSVYAKLIHGRSTAKQELRHIKSVVPDEGSVRTLCMGLNDFEKMSTLVGDQFDMGLFSDEVLVI